MCPLFPLYQWFPSCGPGTRSCSSVTWTCLECKFLGHIPGILNHRLGVGSSHTYADKSFRWFSCKLKFKNHCIFQMTCSSSHPPCFLLLLFLSFLEWSFFSSLTVSSYLPLQTWFRLCFFFLLTYPHSRLTQRSLFMSLISYTYLHYSPFYIVLLL